MALSTNGHDTTDVSRPEPLLDELSTPFWTGGATGSLLIARCRGCGWRLHPPRPRCPRCYSADIAPEAVSGDGHVWSFTVSRYQWSPALVPPYTLVLVELVEQRGLVLLTELVDCDDAHIGLPVHVRFEPAGRAWAPVFAP